MIVKNRCKSEAFNLKLKSLFKVKVNLEEGLHSKETSAFYIIFVAVNFIKLLCTFVSIIKICYRIITIQLQSAVQVFAWFISFNQKKNRLNR